MSSIESKMYAHYLSDMERKINNNLDAFNYNELTLEEYGILQTLLSGVVAYTNHLVAHQTNYEEES